MIVECLRYNSTVESTVYVLTDPVDTQGKIYIKASFNIEIFINPCHSYFYQILLQYKVVTNYVQLSPTNKSLGSVKNFMVSAFFRKRNFTDPAECYIGDTEKLDTDVEIPVALIVTKVRIPHGVIVESIQKAANFWTKCSEEEFQYGPWVPSVLFAGGDITP